MTENEMKINGCPLSLYGAELLKSIVYPCDMGKRYFLPPSSIMPVILSSRVGLRKIDLFIDFSGKSKYEIEMNISNLTAVLQNVTELYLSDGFYYTVVYEKIERQDEVAPWIEQVIITVYGFRHGPKETLFLSQNKTVFIKGNQTTPSIVKIVPKGSTEVKINDITVKNISGEVVIDGMTGTVMENGLNKFADIDMTEFPKFKPGANKVTLVGDADVEISYYPIYL